MTRRAWTPGESGGFVKARHADAKDRMKLMLFVGLLERNARTFKFLGPVVAGACY